ncbi:hypothetical protein H0H81_012349 [Sphagnurus paluster]|uniref:Uncharacterized protein n=1 Tax=Sphagnurus paluster TaxID=117069 RepID=A0A9P7GQG6_9AGAR|nr:hypothetical protein H0H81_012349 [Sphagnurus paluster]
MSRAALEMVGQGGLGYSFDSLVDVASEHPYTEAAKGLTAALPPLQLARDLLLPTIVKIGTPKFRRACLDLLPYKAALKLKNIVDILDKTSIEIFQAKKESLERGDEAVQEQVGKDIISVLMKGNIEAADSERLDDKEVIGQDKLRGEVQAAREQYGEIPYDVLMALPFLDAICRESMRL